MRDLLVELTSSGVNSGIQGTASWTSRRLGKHQRMLFHPTQPTVILLPEPCTILPCEPDLVILPQSDPFRWEQSVHVPSPLSPEHRFYSHESPSAEDLQQCPCDPSSFIPDLKEQLEEKARLGVSLEWVPVPQVIYSPPDLCCLGPFKPNPP